MGLSLEFAILWPILQHALAAILMVLAVEGLYLLAPGLKQGLHSSLPGAVFAVVAWILLSDGLSLYFQKFSHLNRTYGVLSQAASRCWSGCIGRLRHPGRCRTEL
jgi:uncharacterized BrkB/YihY/UPF0761 family membrane protein